MIMIIYRYLIKISLFLFSFIFLTSGNWPQWRGPLLNGSGDDSKTPVSWTLKDKITWESDLPGIGASTPVIWDQKIFLTSCNIDNKDLFALCLNRKSGKILWQYKIGQSYDSKRDNTAASSSPVTDGHSVVFLFGTGQLIAYTMDGKKIWERNLIDEYGPMEYWYGYSASPLLYKNKLYIQVMHQHTSEKLDVSKKKPESYIICIDKNTGKNIWFHLRPPGPYAFKETLQSYTTPLPFKTSKGIQIIMVGGNYVTAHDPVTGALQWHSDPFNTKQEKWFRNVASAVYIGSGLLISTPRGNSMYVISKSVDSKVDKSDILWKQDLNAADVCTPLFYKNRIYVLKGLRKILSCVEPKTGEIIWKSKLDSKSVFYSSPTASDDKIYFQNNSGMVYIVSAGDKFQLLNTIEMGSSARGSSLSLSDNQVFVRADDKLFCIGE
jgi:outer membrane protein assembly factor BamB